MTIQRINYLAISEDLRKKGAAKRRENLHNLLASPLLTDEQRLVVREKLDHVRQWEHGELEVEVLPGETIPEEVLKKVQAKKDRDKLRVQAREGRNHPVEVEETIEVGEETG